MFRKKLHEKAKGKEKLKMLKNLVGKGKSWEDLKPQWVCGGYRDLPLANSLSTLAEKESRSSLQEGEGTL